MVGVVVALNDYPDDDDYCRLDDGVMFGVDADLDEGSFDGTWDGTLDGDKLVKAGGSNFGLKNGTPLGASLGSIDGDNDDALVGVYVKKY